MEPTQGKLRIIVNSQIPTPFPWSVGSNGPETPNLSSLSVPSDMCHQASVEALI